MHFEDDEDDEEEEKGENNEATIIWNLNLNHLKKDRLLRR